MKTVQEIIINKIVDFTDEMDKSILNKFVVRTFVGVEIIMGDVNNLVFRHSNGTKESL